MLVTKVIASPGRIVLLEDCGPIKLEITSHGIVDLRETATKTQIQRSRLLAEFLGTGALIAVTKEEDVELTSPPPTIHIPEMRVGGATPSAHITMTSVPGPEGGLPVAEVTNTVSPEDQARINAALRIQAQVAAEEQLPETVVDRLPKESSAMVPDMKTSVQGAKTPEGYAFKAPLSPELAAAKAREADLAALPTTKTVVPKTAPPAKKKK